MDCENRIEEGIIANATLTHKLFSYLNQHPDAHEKSLLMVFPKEVGYKQAKMHYYIWLKITKEKYKITLTEEEKALISQEAL